jgi:hypothetical protein
MTLTDLRTLTDAMEVCNRLACDGERPADKTTAAVLAIAEVLGMVDHDQHAQNVAFAETAS